MERVKLLGVEVDALSMPQLNSRVQEADPER